MKYYISSRMANALSGLPVLPDNLDLRLFRDIEIVAGALAMVNQAFV